MRELDEKLWLAVIAGNEKNITECLQNGANPLSMTDDKVTIAHAAAAKNAESALKILLDFTENKILEAKGGEEEVTLLTCAVAGGHENIIRLLLARGANIEARSKSEATPLVEAIGQGRLDIVKLLVDKGANVNAICDGSSPLSLAVLMGNPEIVKILIDAKVDLEAKDQNGNTALLRALQEKNIAVIKLLLDANANIEGRASDNRTPLHYAVIHNYEECVRLLLERGANIEAKLNDNETPLTIAVKINAESLVRLLLKWGADLSVAVKTNEGTLSLVTASTVHKDSAILALLLEQKDNSSVSKDNLFPAMLSAINCKNKNALQLLLNKVDNIEGDYGLTLFFVAIDQDEENILQVLLNKGVDINAKAGTGHTALFIAVAKGKINASRFLLKNGADIYVVLDGKGTPFAQAVIRGDEKLISLFLGARKIDIDTLTISLYQAIADKRANIAKLLLDHGADANGKNIVQENPTGRTPLHEAIDSNQEAIVKLLLEKGADSSLTDNEGHTAKAFAVSKKWRNITKLLEKNSKTASPVFSTPQAKATLFKPPPSKYLKGQPAPPPPKSKHNQETDQLLEKTQESSSKCCVVI